MNDRIEQAPHAPASDGALMRDARTIPVLAKTIFRELKQNGLTDEDIIRVASELLAQVTSGLRSRPR